MIGDTIQIHTQFGIERGFVIERRNTSIIVDGRYKRTTSTTDRLLVPVIKGKLNKVTAMPFGRQYTCRIVLVEKSALGRIINKDGADIVRFSED